MERDPEPTDPMASATCTIRACPCRAFARAADAWHTAYEFVRDRDEGDTRVINFVPGPKVRRR